MVFYSFHQRKDQQVDLIHRDSLDETLFETHHRFLFLQQIQQRQTLKLERHEALIMQIPIFQSLPIVSKECVLIRAV